MTTEKLIEFLEEKGFSVSLHTDSDGETEAELEDWTKGGVNMLIYVSPFNVETVIETFNNFDVDSEIDLHRESDRYRKAFTISQSLEDFTKWEEHLNEIVECLEKIEDEDE